MAELLQITRGCEYAIKAMVWIASQPVDTIVQADLIAEGAGLPTAFAGNILTRLSKSGLLSAHRGASRGYRLAGKPSEVTLLQIIEAYDGTFEKPLCFMNRDRACNPNSPCALHNTWQAVRENTRQVLAEMTLARMTNGTGSTRINLGSGMPGEGKSSKQTDLKSFSGSSLIEEFNARF